MPLIEVRGTTLHYRFDGPEKGPVVMLSNSLASDLTMWDRQVPALVQAGFRVLRYDSRGHGRSAVPQGPYTIKELTDDAVGLMDALGLERVHFCGLSKGGMIGQMMGAKHGDRLTKLILSSTAAHLPGREIWDERIKTVREHGMEAVADGTLERWFTKVGRERLPAEVEKIRRMILATPVEGYCASCAAIQDMDLRGSLGDITTPVLIIVGEQDPGTPVSAGAFIHKQIASSKLMVVADAAHLVQMEQAKVFNEALLRFIYHGGEDINRE